MGLLATLMPFAPLVLKLAMGLLPPKAAVVVGQVVQTAKQGLAIAEPVINTLNNIAGLPETGGADISVSEMQEAINQLHAAGPFEASLAKAKAAS